jgi:hypothetical protein
MYEDLLLIEPLVLSLLLDEFRVPVADIRYVLLIGALRLEALAGLPLSSRSSRVEGIRGVYRSQIRHAEVSQGEVHLHPSRGGAPTRCHTPSPLSGMSRSKSSCV